MDAQTDLYLKQLVRACMSAVGNSEAPAETQLALASKALNFLRPLYRAYEDREFNALAAQWSATEELLEPEQVQP